MAAERIAGVLEARFAYPEGMSTVTYDTTVTSASVVLAELARTTGYGFAPRADGPAGRPARGPDPPARRN